MKRRGGILNAHYKVKEELPGGLSGKESTRRCWRYRFNPWIEKIPWRKKWQPTPVFLPGKTYRQRSLVGYNPWGTKSWTWLTNWACMPVKEVNLKRLHILWFQLYGIWKMPNYTTVKASGCQGFIWGEEGWIGREERIFRALRIHCIPWWWIHTGIHFSKPIEWITPKVNLNGHCELWVIMMGQ